MSSPATIPRPIESGRRTIAIVTGSRAEFGLLLPVMRAVRDHPRLDLQVVVTGTHLLPPANTIEDVEREMKIAHVVHMQTPDESGRLADAAAVGRGVTGVAAWLNSNPVDALVVLGDRVEAFAAASAASIGGVRVAHLHGGDRAEGVADEAMRHAISKLAHIHLPATARSAERLLAMGEEPRCTHLVGSPAIDGLDSVAPLDDDAYAELGSPEIIVMLHPTGADDGIERTHATALIDGCAERGRVLVLHPNHDAGREGIVEAIETSAARADGDHRVTALEHLPRPVFLSLLRRVRFLAGNSSSGLIECSALRIRCLNVGPRQSGREKPLNVINCPNWERGALARSIDRAAVEPVLPFRHPYGDGRAGERTAVILATLDPDNHPTTKRNTY